MEFPIRCFTCGGVVGHAYDEYKELIKEKSPQEALDILGFDRFCCRRMFLSHVELIESVMKYPRA